MKVSKENAARSEAAEALCRESVDPALRVRDLMSETSSLISVAPDALLTKALTLMLTHDFSQLPVFSRENSLKGVVSWRTIGTQATLGVASKLVKDYTEYPASTVQIDAPLFDAVDLVASNDYVVVLDGTRVVGILTATDFSLQYRKLAEPFLLIGEVERGLRLLLEGNFEAADLRTAEFAPGCGAAGKNLDELSFGDYVFLCEKPNVWQRLELNLDRTVFRNRLERVRTIRNHVMHFRPDGIGAEELECLHSFARFMRRIREVRSNAAEQVPSEP